MATLIPEQSTPWPRARLRSRRDRGRGAGFGALVFASKLTACVCTVEAVALAVSGAISLSRVFDNPASGLAQAVETSPGIYAHPHFDIVRAGAFILAATVSCVVLVIAAWALWRTPPRRWRDTTRTARLCVTSVVLVDVGWTLAFGLSALWSSDATAGGATLAWLLALTATAGGAAAVRAAGRRIVVLAVVMALALGGTLAVTLGADASAYASTTGGNPAGDGFWTVTTSQQPASGTSVFEACGSARVCALFGSGVYHKTAEPQGEVTVTADGGRSWHSWLLPAPLYGFEPFGIFPICHGDDCVATVTEYDGAPGLSHLTISPDGDIAQQLARGHRSWTLSSCPTAGWCAGIDEGSSSIGGVGGAYSAPGLLTSSDGGRTWASHQLPQWLVPADDIVQGTMSCPVVDQCVMAGSLRLGLTRPSAAQRAASRYGASFVALTTDGGLTWTQSVVPAGLSGLGSPVCTDAMHCLALALTQTGQPSMVVRSDDGGRTWSPATAPLLATLDLDHLVCADTADCLLFGTVAPPGPNQTVMYRTTDAGATWHRAPLPESTTLLSAACPSATFCVATGFRSVPHAYVAAGGDTLHFTPFNVPTLLTTHDGGISWHETVLPPPRELAR